MLPLKQVYISAQTTIWITLCVLLYVPFGECGPHSFRMYLSSQHIHVLLNFSLWLSYLPVLSSKHSSLSSKFSAPWAKTQCFPSSEKHLVTLKSAMHHSKLLLNIYLCVLVVTYTLESWLQPLFQSSGCFIIWVALWELCTELFWLEFMITHLFYFLGVKSGLPFSLDLPVLSPGLVYLRHWDMFY